MGKPTPGPWRYVRENGSPTTGQHMINGAIPGYLAEVRDCGSGDVAANARLIAAAPELLKLAEQYASECSECEGRGYVVTYVDPYQRGDVSSPEQSPCPDCADIRAAIAKATGASHE